MVDGVKSRDAEKVKILAWQRIVKDWSQSDLIIYSDGLATNGTAIGGVGILATAGNPSKHTIHHSCDMPVGTWCSSFQAEMMAIKKA